MINDKFFKALDRINIPESIEMQLVEDILEFFVDVIDETDPQELAYLLTTLRKHENLYNNIRDEVLKDNDRCEICLSKLSDEDYIKEKEIHDYWGAPCSQEIVTGYNCSICNYKGAF